MQNLKEILDEPIVLDYSPVEHKMRLSKKIVLIGVVVAGGIAAGAITCKYVTYLGEYYTARAIHLEKLVP